MTPEERLRGWIDWVEGDLWTQVHEIFNQVMVFRSWNELVGEASEESRRDGFFHAWVLHNYLDSITTGVRRLADPDGRTTSLVRLLMELEEGAKQLTIEWWMSAAVPGDKGIWEARFHELSRGKGHIDPRLVRADRLSVCAASEKLKAYVDKHIAHLDKDRGMIEVPTIGDAHAAINTIYRTYHRWFQIITGSALAPLQPPRWEHVFSIPWITLEQAAAIAERRREEWKEEMREMGLTSQG